jgi:hypothetical protein
MAKIRGEITSFIRVKLIRQYYPGKIFAFAKPAFHLPDSAPSYSRSEVATGGCISGNPLMLTVHHLNNSRSQRVLWLLEELGVPYEIVRYQRQKNMLAPPELHVVHPLGKSPVCATPIGCIMPKDRRCRRC